MTDLEKWKVQLGAVLFLIATAVIVAVSGQIISGVPLVIGSLAALTIAAGTLLLGTSHGGRPV